MEKMTTEPLTFKLNALDKQMLEERAAAEERTVSAILRLLVRRYLNEGPVMK